MDVIKARMTFKKCKKEFEAMFGVPLATYWDIRTPRGIALGFELIKFDEEVIKSGNKRMTAIVQKQYGLKAIKMLEYLIQESTC